MNVESQKKLCVTCIFGFIVLLVIIIVGWLRWPAPKPQTENVHQIRMEYNAQGQLEFKDAQGNAIEPRVLDKDNPIGDLFKNRSPSTIKKSGQLIVFDATINPRCSPMIISGNLCVAPHTYCCQVQ